jgi:hypothetical protein
MSTALFLPRYFELMRTAADTRLVDSHSDQQLIRAHSGSGNPTKKLSGRMRRSTQRPYAAQG